MAGSQDLTFAYPVVPILRADGETWQYIREPLLRRMPDGSLLCLHYSGGPREPHNDNAVLVTRSVDAGASWSAPEVLFRHGVRGCWSTELLVHGNTVCAFVSTLHARSHYNELHTYRAFSNDSGKTWSEPSSLPGPFHCVSPRQALLLTSGEIVVPVYWQEQHAGFDWTTDGARDWRFHCGVLRSEDGGRHFTQHGNIRAAAGLSLWEPNVVEVAPGRLVMMIRATGDGRLYRADSTDAGRHWSDAMRTQIGADSSKVTLLRVGGCVLMLFNPGGDTRFGGRRDLQLWVSSDGCATWSTKLSIAQAPEGRRICYPHGFIDAVRKEVVLALDDTRTHWFMRIPLADLGLPQEDIFQGDERSLHR